MLAFSKRRRHSDLTSSLKTDCLSESILSRNTHQCSCIVNIFTIIRFPFFLEKKIKTYVMSSLGRETFRAVWPSISKGRFAKRYSETPISKKSAHPTKLDSKTMMMVGVASLGVAYAYFMIVGTPDRVAAEATGKEDKSSRPRRASEK